MKDCEYRILYEERPEKCSCKHAAYSYKGLFDKRFCETCPINNQANMVDSIVNLAKEVPKQIKYGFKKSNKTIYEERLEICKGCEMYDEHWQKCKSCGCFLYIKATLEGSECPLDKWPKKQ